MPSSSTRAHRHRHAEALELLEAEAALLSLAVEAGVVPACATRAPFAHELEARTNFAELEVEVDTTAGRIANRVRQARLAIADELEDRLLAAAGNGADIRAVVREVTDLSDPILPTTLGARTTAALVNDVRIELEAAAREGHARALSEARAQGIPVNRVPAFAGEALEDELDRGAIRLGRQPVGRVISASVGYAYGEAVYDMAPGDFAEEVRNRAASLSDKPELDEARQETHKLNGLGRQQAAAALPAMAAIYASELLDGSTCGPCSLVDGRRYASLEGARIDYPSGRYRSCEGGDRCRGTLVFVWDEESTPTIGGDEGPDVPAPELNPTPDAGGAGVAPVVDWRERLARHRAQRPAEWAPTTGDPFREDDWADAYRAANGGRRPTLEDVTRARAAHDAARLSTAFEHEALIRSAGRTIADELDRRLVAAGVDRGALSAAEDAFRALDAELNAAANNVRRVMRENGGRGIGPDYEEARDARREVEARWRDALADRERLQKEVTAAEGRVLRELLGEVQEQGPGGLRHRFASGSTKRDGIDALAVALEAMPRRWIEASVRHSEDVNPLYVGNIQRGHYRQRDTRRVKGRLEVISRLNASGTGDDAVRVAAHEFGHRIEHVLPEVRRLEQAFYRRRTADAVSPTGQEAPSWLGPGYGRDERARRDKFVEHYMGKDYGNGPTSYYELLSMGLEAVTRGKYGGLRDDPDMRDFILGLLVSV